jgi:P4 family phage/plasmid primase-like protien
LTLEDDGVSEIGIIDGMVFAIYKDTRIEVPLNKEDWTETLKRLVPELNKVIPEDIVTKIIKELSLDHVELARLEKLEERSEVHISKEEQRILDAVGTSSNNGNKRKSSKQQYSCSEEKEDPIQVATEFVMSCYNFATIEESREILYYSNGVYLSGGDIIIEKVVEKQLGFEAASGIISEVKGHVARLTYHKREEFDSDINIINMMNGLYDIEGDELLPHDTNYLSCHQIPVVHVKGAKPKLFGKFLKDVLYPRDIRTGVDIMAYTFRRDYDIEVIFTLYGIGANGKTVYTSVIIGLHGPKHVSNVPLSSMAGDKDRFALSDLENKNVNIDNELDNQIIKDSATLKRLTQGSRQPIRIQRKNQKAYDTILYAKLIFNANRVPYSLDRSDGYNRRMKIVVFPNAMLHDRTVFLGSLMMIQAILLNQL